ncbi:hypothetical protein RO3G_12633 [Lichtheimia corymbifera JMRC:FSU:9682]|uniref:Septin-type G domain-containing protein n=1 Tax=Lichtheimia corymbifera JMRC:FSU:9682 TaxID=1263082 RepID=A0A068RJ67_9FUNG|nr:hypothetical protein RO3G_12633 [Lichtheimia corymbifera JMRC:FSU:9682]
MEPLENTIPRRFQRQQRTLSDHWSDDYSSEKSPAYAKTENSSAAWSLRDDSNAELVVPQVMIQSLGITRQDIGHLRVIVCGDSGIGKTAMIQALTMLPEITACEVATDVECSNPSFMTNFLETDEEKEEEYDEASSFAKDEIGLNIQETFASTMTAPFWSRDNQQQQQQQPNDHQIFIKNICLVDTPGYGACIDAQSVITSVASYIERQFQKTSNMLNPMYPNTPEVTRLVHNPYGAHTHVDACIYVVLDRFKRVDIEYMRAIHHLCNVIPVIIKHDQLTQDQENELKKDVLRELDENGIETFTTSCNPFILPDTTHVDDLRDALFYSHIEHLRRSTATKFVTWRASQIMISSSTMSSTLTASTLTSAETVDRMHALRTRHEQNMNLYISRYVSEKRKTMERDMFERERALKNELASVERRKRAELLVNELNQLFQQGSIDDLKVLRPTTTSHSQQGKGSTTSSPSSSVEGNHGNKGRPLLLQQQKVDNMIQLVLFIIGLHLIFDVVCTIYLHQ